MKDRDPEDPYWSLWEESDRLEARRQQRIRQHRRWMYVFVVLALIAGMIALFDGGWWWYTTGIWIVSAALQYHLMRIWRRT